MTPDERLARHLRQMDEALRHAKVDHLTRKLMLEQFERIGDARRRRKPPEAGMAVPAVPPSGPLPKQGGAEAPLDFA